MNTLSYIGTATIEGMTQTMMVLSDIH